MHRCREFAMGVLTLTLAACADSTTPTTPSPLGQVASRQTWSVAYTLAP